MFRFFSTAGGRRAEYGCFHQNGHHEYWTGVAVPLSLVEGNEMQQKVALVIGIVSEITGKPAFVVGGAARDIAFKRTPKDWDIVVAMDSSDEEEGFSLAERITIRLATELPGHTIDVSQAYSTANSSFDERYLAIVQLDGPGGFSVDILLARAKSVRDVVLSFDANINQAAIMNHHTFKDYDVLWFTPDWERPTKLEFLRSDLTPERVLHVLKIAEELGIENPSS